MGDSQDDDVAALNAAVDRIRKLIPDQPYIQTIPQDGTRWDHHHHESARVWRGRAPFDREERPDLQYQTFHYHEHGTDLIHLRIHSPPPESRRDKAEPTSSAVRTPRLGAKKKMSLADYKNQKTKGVTLGGGTEEISRAAHINGHSRSIGGDTPRSAKNDDHATQTRDFANSEATSSLKRKRSQDARHDSDHDSRAKRRPSMDRSHNGRREGSQSPTPSRKRKTEDSKAHPGRLPAPLSPLQTIMPDRLSPLGSFLPELLSPSLPPNIVAELDRRARMRDEPEADAGTERREKEPNSGKSKGDHARNGNHEGSNPGGRRGGGAHKLIIILKIPKRLRSDYRRLLQFKPRPSAESANDRRRARSPSPRRNSEVGRKDPDTPLQPPFQSPPLPTRHAANVHTTPSSKRPGGTMHRVPSTDGHMASSAAATPTASSTTSAAHPAHTKPSPTSVPSQPTKESEAWHAESNRLQQIGKALKSAARQYENSDTELSLLTNIESLCAFMLSFHASDMSCQTQRPPAVPSARRTWVSLNGFWRFIWDRSEKHPALKSVIAGLGQCYIGRICAWVAAGSKEREREGIDAVAMLSRISSGPRMGLAASKKMWPETWRRCLSEGTDEVLLASASTEEDQGLPGRYNGPLELPMGIQTPVLRGVRTTLSMLGEWKTKGKPFQATIRLGK